MTTSRSRSLLFGLTLGLTSCGFGVNLSRSNPLDQFTQGFACEPDSLGGLHTQVLSDDLTARAVFDESSMSLHLGRRLATGLDDDNCDDVLQNGATADPELHMTYLSTAGSITATDGPDGRSLELVGVVLTPQPPTEESGPAYEDPAEHDPIELEGRLEWIPIGGSLQPFVAPTD